MHTNYITLSVDKIDDMFDRRPEPGDSVNYGGSEYIITQTTIKNESRMELQVQPKTSDASPQLSDGFLEDEEEKSNPTFIEEGSLYKR